MMSEQHKITCSHCGNDKFTRIPGTWSPTAINNGEPVEGLSIPLVMLGCAHCGMVQFFNPKAVKPIPFPVQDGRPVLFLEE